MDVACWRHACTAYFFIGLTIADLQQVYEVDAGEKTSVKARKVSRLRKVRMDETSHSVQTPSLGIVDRIDWHAAWSEYVRGHVVSKASSDLVKSFCCTL